MNNNKVNISSLKRKSLASAVACIYMSLAFAPVYASDTEIYVAATDESTISPNLLMMIDTSGSMAWCMTDDNSCASPNQRMDILKDAMQKILRGTATTKAVPGNVKMGLGRYHPANADKGGYIAYPARPLDAFVQINPNGVVSSTGATGNSDGVQAAASNLTATEIKIGLDGANNNAAGFHFEKVRVPKGATVTEAYIQVVANGTNSGTSTWEIAAHAIGDAPAFNSTAINSRPYGEEFVYQPDAWVAGEKQSIPVTSVVNEVVNRSDWCGDNALAIRIRDIGVTPTTRRAYSFEGAGSNPDLTPQLVIKYTIDPEKTDSCIKNAPRTMVISLTDIKDDAEWWSNSSGSIDNNNSTITFNRLSSSTQKNIVGLYYRNLPIKAGSTITSAILLGRPSNNYTSVNQVLVKGIKVVDLAPFCASTCITPTAANALAKTSASVLWTPSGNALTKDVTYPIDVTTLVSEIVGQAGWGEGKNMAFTLMNNTNTNHSTANFRSRDNTAITHVQLQINWIDPLVTNLTVLETVRDQLEAEVKLLKPSGGTPLAAAYAEASRYLYGLAPFNTTAADYDSRTVTTATPKKYISPIPADDECSANYVFLLTDGEPTNDASNKSNTQGIMTKTCTGGSNAAQWDCMLKLADYNVSNKTGAAVPLPKKRVRTNTVILGPLGGTAETQMKAVAAAGQGQYYKAENVEQLITAISETIDDALELSGTITAAGVAVNQLNRLNHLDQLYYAVFEPRPKSYRWDGNLKRYKLGGNGSMILDANNVGAVDPSTGFFKAEAKSFWSPTVDGKSAVLGGAASMLPAPDGANSRKMFTYMGSLASKNVALTPIDLNSSTFNSSAKTATGVSDNATYTNLMNWYKGYEVSSLYDGLETPTVERKQLGAALHSEPILVNYGYTGTLADANNPDNQKNYVFFSTLEGTLHAIDAKTGKEKFSFIPGEKLATLKDRYDNPMAGLPEFGMDLTWNAWRKDADATGQIDAGDKVYLYGGMRMGGKNYYALDATDLNNPKLLFAIQGGTGKYVNMGQSWSKPIITNIKVGNVNKSVLVFGGGYDPRHESANEIFTGNDKGNQLYIVDALTGDLLWFASGNSSDSPNKYVADMKFSVPTSPRAVDINGDGITDAIYFGDLGGQIFRVDIDNKAASNNAIAKRVHLLAKVGQTETANAESQRRFYEPPTVATFKDSAGNKFATVSIGSGYRSRPLNVVTKERYFVFFDKDVHKANLTTMDDSALQATIATPNLVELDMNSSATKLNGVDVTNKMGWYINFPESGEKSLATGLVFNSKLVFTSYSPTFAGASNCSPVAGKTNQYVFCMPYGKLCSTTSSYVKPNIMLGLGGAPQLMVIPDTANPGKFKVTLLTGTSLDPDIFSDAGDGSASLEPSKKWREKLGN